MRPAQSQTVQLDRQSGRLFVAQALDPEPGAKLPHSGGQSVEVLDTPPNQAVEVTGGPFGSISLSGHATDHEIVDAVAVEDLRDASNVR